MEEEESSSRSTMEMYFCALEPWGTVGEEALFYRARKLHVIEFSRFSGAEPRVAPYCTPDQV
jgi:hypothetical protein